MSREPDLKTGAKWAEHFGFAAEMLSLRINGEGIGRSLRVKGVPSPATENRAHTCPCIRREPRARNWIAQRECTKDSADGMIVIDSLVNKYWDRLVFENIETRFAGVQCKSLHTETSIATEEIFYVPAAAPCMVAADVTVVRTKDRAALAGTLDDIDQRRIRRELGVSKRICAPEIHIPFAIAVPLRARRDVRDLLHSFVGILS